MKVRIVALLLACLVGPGCASAELERETPAAVAADLPVERLHELMAQRRYYEGFLLWPKVEKALAKTNGRGTLGREYARLISVTAIATRSHHGD